MQIRTIHAIPFRLLQSERGTDAALDALYAAISGQVDSVQVVKTWDESVGGGRIAAHYDLVDVATVTFTGAEPHIDKVATIRGLGKTDKAAKDDFLKNLLNPFEYANDFLKTNGDICLTFIGTGTITEPEYLIRVAP